MVVAPSPGTPAGLHASADVQVEQLDAVFGTRGDACRCWCQWFRLTNADYRRTTTDGRRALTTADLAGPGPSPGVVATVGGEPVGWCAVAPWSDYPRLRTSPSSGSQLHDPGDARPSSAELFHGSLSMFLAAGFTEVARPTPSRVVVRRELA